ncbi:hypothetical protein [Pseudanabaena sp. FACHB-2040]|uniref:hypothetical protein n=1 Tax=Pseudanabaena sp. FACHB-2040 TaxID=2692859 RepID=UPI0016886E76|nr:hypothetical protein [Pseudanabaena sp. FACHB-2040]MBD2257918.1 hypothetical protein [Pseudanabaena sp. FACHB-2040]
MINIISGAITRVSSLLKALQVKRFLAAVLVGFILLSTTVGSEPVGRDVTKKVDKIIHQGDSDRPKTTGEWNREARATEDAPGKRAARIGEETKEAVKDWAGLYPDVAKRTIPGVGD